MEGKTIIGVVAISIRLAAMAIIIAMLGAYPTWKCCGMSGLLALVTAGVIVLVVMVASVFLVLHEMKAGAARAAAAVMYGGMLRTVAVLGLWVGAWQALKFSPVTSIIWVAIFYFPLLGAQSVWMSKALKGRP